MLILSLWELSAGDPLQGILIICGVLIGVFGAITIHEFAHAWMATRLGDDTAKHLGRLTLNPLSHIDPLGLFLFIMAGFGYGRPVPYNLRHLKGDFDEIKIALAGPASNFLVAILLALPYRIAITTGVDLSHSGLIIFLNFIDTIVYMNLVLGVFNLIPIPPLDGSKVLNYFLDDDAKETWARLGPMLLLFLIFSGAIFRNTDFNLLDKILTPLLHFASLIVRGTPSF